MSAHSPKDTKRQHPSQPQSVYQSGKRYRSIQNSSLVKYVFWLHNPVVVNRMLNKPLKLMTFQLKLGCSLSYVHLRVFGLLSSFFKILTPWLKWRTTQPLCVSSSGWAPCWLRAVKAVCSCLRSYKRVVEFFHCGANGGGLTGGEGLQAHECVFGCVCVCIYLHVHLCVNTHQSWCVVSPGEPTWPFTANTQLIAQIEFIWGLRVKMPCV